MKLTLNDVTFCVRGLCSSSSKQNRRKIKGKLGKQKNEARQIQRKIFSSVLPMCARIKKTNCRPYLIHDRYISIRLIVSNVKGERRGGKWMWISGLGEMCLSSEFSSIWQFWERDAWNDHEWRQAGNFVKYSVGQRCSTAARATPFVSFAKSTPQRGASRREIFARAQYMNISGVGVHLHTMQTSFDYEWGKFHHTPFERKKNRVIGTFS